jgi:DNA polymerase-3 subunit delta
MTRRGIYIEAMPTAGERALRKSIRDRSFDRVYYFHGADDYLKEVTARELVDAVLDPATRDFNHEVLRGSEVGAETLDTALATPAMFAERRVVVIRDVHALKKAARGALDAYLAGPAGDVVLLLLDPAGETPDRLIAERATVVEFDRLEDRRVPAWIMHHARTVLGVEISDTAAALLQVAAGSELAVLASELDKLASYTGGTRIDEQAVREVAGVKRGETMSDLLDAVAERNAARAVSLIPALLAQPKSSAVTMIMSLTTQMLALAWGRAARDRGVPMAGVERGFYSLLKEGKAYPGRSWKDAVACWSRAIPHWSAGDLERALNELLVADVAAKEARVSSEEQLLTSLVLTLCAPAARAAA